MSIKSEMNHDGETGKIPFPKLMINGKKDLVVRFTSAGCGVVVYSRGYYNEGEEVDNFAPRAFTDFHGSITLSNE